MIAAGKLRRLRVPQVQEVCSVLSRGSNGVIVATQLLLQAFQAEWASSHILLRWQKGGGGGHGTDRLRLPELVAWLLQDFQPERASSRILARWQKEGSTGGIACDSLDLGPISPPAQVLSERSALTHAASMSPMADTSNTTPRLDSSSESIIQQVR